MNKKYIFTSRVACRGKNTYIRSPPNFVPLRRKAQVPCKTGVVISGHRDIGLDHEYRTETPP